MEEYKKIISQSKSIVITAHKSPDGDAIGSSLALYHYLKNTGKDDVSVIVPDGFPEFLNWMEGVDKIIYYDTQNELAEEIIGKADLIFSLDYNALSRIGDLSEPVKNSTATKIVIDHHQDPQEFATHYFVDTDCCSTAQLIYELIEGMGGLDYLNSAIAECIYCGIMTDTGSFRYPSTTSKTHKIVGSLIDLGADGSKIHQEIYDTNSEDRLRLLGYSLTNKMKVFKDLNAAYISLSQEELKTYNFKKGDTEGLVNYPLSINGIKFSALITEKEDGVTLSLRSKGNFYVNKFANENFSGGGHIYASGGKSDLTLAETVSKFEKLLEDYKDQLKD
jgi:bifunctional oligoribonuclease and PAP phosphatase NrnA